MKQFFVSPEKFEKWRIREYNPLTTVCPFITQENVDRFLCGFFHWIAKNNESDMADKKLEKKNEKRGHF